MAKHTNPCNLCDIGGSSAYMPAERQRHRQRDRRSNDPGYTKRVNEVIEDVMTGKYTSWNDAQRKTGVGLIIIKGLFYSTILLGPKVYVDIKGKG